MPAADHIIINAQKVNILSNRIVSTANNQLIIKAKQAAKSLPTFYNQMGHFLSLN